MAKLKLSLLDILLLVLVFCLALIVSGMIEHQQVQKEMTQTMTLWSGEIIEEHLRLDQPKLISVLARQLALQGIQILDVHKLNSSGPDHLVWTANLEANHCFIRQKELLHLSLVPVLSAELCVMKKAFLAKVFLSESFTLLWFLLLLGLLVFFWVRAQFRQSTEQAQDEMRLFEQKAQFAAQVAHDLRSPVGALKILFEESVVQEGDQEKETQKKELLAMAIARLEAMTTKLTHQSVHRGELINIKVWRKQLEQLLKLNQLRFPEQSYQLSLDLNSETYWSSPLSGEQIQRILQNLVVNAWEAQASAKVNSEVQIEILRVEKAVIIRVRDSGPGVPEDLLPRLGQSGETRGKEAGTGLGLFQIKKWVQQVDGQMSIENHLSPQGLLVTIHLPLLGEAGGSIHLIPS